VGKSRSKGRTKTLTMNLSTAEVVVEDRKEDATLLDKFRRGMREGGAGGPDRKKSILRAVRLFRKNSKRLIKKQNLTPERRKPGVVAIEHTPGKGKVMKKSPPRKRKLQVRAERPF